MLRRRPWWARSWTPRPSAALDPRTHLVSREEVGESIWLPMLAVIGAASLYATLPGRFITGPSSGALSVSRWIVPVLALALLAPLALTAPKRRLVPSVATVGRRALAIALLALVTIANAAAIVLIVHLLVTGAKTHGRDLLRAAIHMWCMNVLVFGLWFWQLDRGGPAKRHTQPGKPDFLFPQETIEGLGETWRPAFLDYLYVSFTNATAFSPTDTMPLSHWAKVLMMVQSAASLLLAVMVAARAVNILS
jgi:hypothetical protein